jgi:hypothetical protein
MSTPDFQNIIKNFFFLQALMDVFEVLTEMLTRFNLAFEVLSELSKFGLLVGGFGTGDVNINGARGWSWGSVLAAISGIRKHSGFFGHGSSGNCRNSL